MGKTKSVPSPDSVKILGKGWKVDYTSKGVEVFAPLEEPNFNLWTPTQKSPANDVEMQNVEGFQSNNAHSVAVDRREETLVVSSKRSKESPNIGDVNSIHKNHNEATKFDEKKKEKVVQVQDVPSEDVSLKRRKVEQTKCQNKELKSGDFYFKLHDHSKLKLGVNSNTNVFKIMRDKLSPKQLDLFRQTCFGYFVNLQPVTVQLRLVHSLLLREVVHENKDEFWISLNGTNLRFGIREFALITGLKCSGIAHKLYDATERCSLVDRCFPGMRKIKCQDIIDCFKGKNWTSDQDTVKIAILYFINTFLFSLFPENKISTGLFELVESEKYENYPWGKLLFEETLTSLRKSFRGKISKQYSRLEGLPLAFQIWFYECCPRAMNEFALFVEDKVPRILSWKVISNPFTSDVTTVLSDVNLKVKNIYPTTIEKTGLDLPNFITDDMDDNVTVDHAEYPFGDDDFTTPPLCQYQITEEFQSLSEFVKESNAKIFDALELLSKKVDGINTHKNEMEFQIKGRVSEGLGGFHDKEEHANSGDRFEFVSTGDEVRNDGVNGNQYVDVVAAKLAMEDPIDMMCVDVPESQITKYKCPKAKEPTANSAAEDPYHMMCIDVPELQITKFTCPEAREPTNESTCLVVKEPTTKYALPKDKEVTPQSTFPVAKESTTTYTCPLAKNGTTDNGIRNKFPSTFCRSPFLNDYGSGESAVGGSMNEPLVLNGHPFEMFVNEDDYNQIMGEFKDWISKGLRKSKLSVYLKKVNVLKPQFEFGVAHINRKEWFHQLAYNGQIIEDTHLDVILYYLRKKGKYDLGAPLKFTTTDTLFNLQIQALYKKYLEKNRDFRVVKPDHDVAQYISGDFIVCNRPWHTVDHILFPIKVSEQWEWITARLSIKDRCLYVYNSLDGAAHKTMVRTVVDAYAVIIPHFFFVLGFFGKRNDIELNKGPYKGKTSENPLKVIMVDHLPVQQHADSGVFAAVFAESFLWNRKMTKTDFDINAHRIRLGSLLWKYGRMKQEQHIVSDLEETEKMKLGRVKQCRQ